MNWGKKVIIGLVSFMVFISVLGIIMIMRSGDDALIENDYYEKGQTFDKDYQAKQDAITDQVIPIITINNGIILTFPVSVKYQLICKRPSDHKLDKNFNGLNEESNIINLSKGELQAGPWLFRIEYTAANKKYLFESEIVMP